MPTNVNCGSIKAMRRESSGGLQTYSMKLEFAENQQKYLQILLLKSYDFYKTSQKIIKTFSRQHLNFEIQIMIERDYKK